MILFQWPVVAAAYRRALITALFTNLILTSIATEQNCIAMSSVSRTAGTTREEATMQRKSSHKYRRGKHDRFQFELLEPRHMFSVSIGTNDMLVQPMSDGVDISIEHQAEWLPESLLDNLEQQADHALTNFQYLPIITLSTTSTSVNAFATLQLDADVFVNSQSNLSLQWTRVTGPGTATFGNATSSNSTVQFDQAGTYELQFSATNFGITSVAHLLVNVSAANVTNIDQAWLDAQGDGPYYLDQQGKTYVLQTDVTTDGTAFAIIAKDVTLDLNGHTITYNNATPITVPNGSCETGTGSAASGWSFTNAANAQRYAGEYLQSTLYDGDYSLRFTP